MALVDSTKVDFLWKKLGYGVTKTDTNVNKQAYNESIPSPLLIRGDRVWAQSDLIPSVFPSGGSTSIVEIYDDSGNVEPTVECTEDITAEDNRTWKTNETDWIGTEFGSTYLVKVYVADAGVSDPQTSGTQLFQAGSGNDDQWFFDYQSGVLNFNGANIPTVIATGITGKSVYIVGARYIGEFGVGSSSGIGNLTVDDTTIGVVNSDANIVLQPDGTGVIQLDTTTSITLPTGNTAARPASPDTGSLRFNSETGALEYYDGAEWSDVGETSTITSQIIVPDGSTSTYTLDQSTTEDSILVQLNGVGQYPGNAYSVAGNTITFSETPTTNDLVEIRFLGVPFEPSDGRLVYSTDQSASTIDVTKAIAVLDGPNTSYILPDGLDGQILYCTPGSGNTANVQVTVQNFCSASGTTSANTVINAFSGNNDWQETGVLTCLFYSGSWRISKQN